MNDYIKKEDAIDMLQKHAERLTHQTNISLSNVRSGVMTAKWLIEDMPTADVRENVKGEWIDRGKDMMIRWQCSECGRKDIHIYNFCPDCGADMREVNYELETRAIN